MDRVDLYISVPRLTPKELLELNSGNAESSATVAKRVIEARARQWERKKYVKAGCNAELSERMLRTKIGLSGDARKYFASMAQRLRLSGRGMSRVLRVSRTIADLAGERDIQASAVSEALAYRDPGVLD